jgi:hypothetical protein
MQLKRVYSHHFPPSGYLALAFCPWVFIREDAKKRYTAKIDRHEVTHALQQVETLWILFIVIYGLEYLIKLPLCDFDHYRTYQSISFEQEAYEHQSETYYNDVRRHYTWMRYLFTIKN